MSLKRTIENQASAFQAYVGIRPSSLGVFAISIVAIGFLATAVYWGVFGFSHWNNEMTVAQRLMTAAAVTQQQPFQQAAPQALGSGQYICSAHGAVGLPRFNAAGLPTCPVCGQVMQFHSFNVAAANQAAFTGG